MIDFRVPGLWDELNLRLERQLKWQGPGHLKLFFGTSAALLEIVTSLQKQFPLRRKLYFCKSADPLVDGVVKCLAREGISLQPLTAAEWADNSWIGKTDKEGLAVIMPMDDPFLGRLYDQTDLQPALASTKLFQISISHSFHRSRGIPPLSHPLQIHLLSLNESLCLGVFGEKAKVPLWVSDTMPFNEEMLETAVDVLSEPQESKDVVLAFENKRLAGCEPFFPSEARRLWDRAVVYWKDMDGSAFIEELAGRIGFGFAQRGASLLAWLLVDRALRTWPPRCTARTSSASPASSCGTTTGTPAITSGLQPAVRAARRGDRAARAGGARRARLLGAVRAHCALALCALGRRGGERRVRAGGQRRRVARAPDLRARRQLRPGRGAGGHPRADRDRGGARRIVLGGQSRCRAVPRPGRGGPHAGHAHAAPRAGARAAVARRGRRDGVVVPRGRSSSPSRPHRSSPRWPWPSCSPR